MRTDKINKRIFVVGSPRSGTTLLQSILGGHKEVYTFPESHFFYHLMNTSKWKRFIKLGNLKESNEKVRMLLDACGRNDLLAKLDKRSSSYQNQIANFVMLLDQIALDKGKNVWVEKTPMHLHYVDVIEKYIEQPVFVHLIRDGFDVISSMYKVTNEHPENWEGARTVEQCTSRWILDVGLSLKCLEKDNHHFVRYENLIGDPVGESSVLFKKLGMDFELNILEDRNKGEMNYVLKDEIWKQNVGQSIEKKSNYQEENLFTVEQKKYILDRIKDVKVEF